jgi:hypothetical protein
LDYSIEKYLNKATSDLHSVIQQVADLTLRKKSKNKRKKTQNEKWFDQDLHKKKKQVKDKEFLMSKYPHDPIIRGSFFKINKEYFKLQITLLSSEAKIETGK